MSVALIAGALLAIASVLLVAFPFIREPAPADDRLVQPDAAQQQRLALAEERDRALAALSDDDYRELVGQLRQRAAETLRRSG